MTLNERLDQYIFDEGIAVEEIPLFYYNGFYDYESDWACPVITLNSNIASERQRAAIKGHELGHHFTLSADLFFAPYLVKSLEIPVEYLYKGLGIYYRKYGLYEDFGQYRIFWNPFNIKKDRRRRK